MKLTHEQLGDGFFTANPVLPAAAKDQWLALKRISIEPHPAKPGCTSQNNAYELTGDTFTLV